MIQVIRLINNETLISQIYQVDAEPGDPNCRLVDPYLFTLGGTSPGFRLTPWMNDCADDNYAMIYPEKILTMRDPKPEVLELYKRLIFISEYDDEQEGVKDPGTQNPKSGGQPMEVEKA